MSEGFKTAIRFQREAALRGLLTGDVLAVPGKVAFFCDRVIESTHRRVDAFRRVQDERPVHVSFRGGFEAELTVSNFIVFLLAMVFRVDGDTYQRSANTSLPSFAFFVAFDNGEKWRFSGAVLTDLVFEVTARKIIRIRGVMCALAATEIGALPAPAADPTTGPMPASDVKLYGAAATGWAIPANPMPITDATTLRFHRDAVPAQFETDGFGTRYALKSGWQFGGDFRAVPQKDFLTALMQSVATTGQLGIRFAGLTDFVFPSVRFDLKTQPALDQRLIRSQVEWTALGVPSLYTDDSVVVVTPATLDFVILRYRWTAAGGSDLDTRTAITTPSRALDCGWSRAATDPNTGPGTDPDDYYLMWGGDNTGAGVESVLINLRKLREDYPEEDEFQIRMRSFWYGARANGGLTLQLVSYFGGTMAPAGYDFVNTDGLEIENIAVNRNATTNTSSNVDGDAMGLLIFNVATNSFTITT